MVVMYGFIELAEASSNGSKESREYYRAPARDPHRRLATGSMALPGSPKALFDRVKVCDLKTVTLCVYLTPSTVVNP
jgi:hypothetical protein